MTLFNRNDKPGGDATVRQQQAHQTQAAPSQAATQVAPPVKAENAAQKHSESRPAELPPVPKPTTKTGASMPSVISKALKITGELESTEDIQIDGQIEGDVRGVGVKIGQNAKVKGTVYGDEVELAGTIEGKIESKKVILAGTARMSGDVWHQEIKVEPGAYINGSLKPDFGKADAKPAYKPAATGSAVSHGSAAPAAVSPASGGNTTAAPHH